MRLPAGGITDALIVKTVGVMDFSFAPVGADVRPGGKTAGQKPGVAVRNEKSGRRGNYCFTTGLNSDEMRIFAVQRLTYGLLQVENMEKVIINSYEDFAKLTGQVIGVSDYLEITQERINQFADATLDHQWIHVDVERAKKESPYKSTIVHGYLTLSLLPYLWQQIITVNNLKMMVNYGMDKMRFGQAVLSGQSVRLVATLQSIANLRGICKAEIRFSIEIKDCKKKALEGVATFLYYFE